MEERDSVSLYRDGEWKAPRHKTSRSTVAEISSLKDFIQRAKYFGVICLQISLTIIESDVLGAVFICLLCFYSVWRR